MIYNQIMPVFPPRVGNLNLVWDIQSPSGWAVSPTYSIISKSISRFRALSPQCNSNSHQRSSPISD